jgi:hypothetical protein
MVELREDITNGFPTGKCNLLLSFRPFWNIWTQLAVNESDGMIMAGARIVIPESCRRLILQDLAAQSCKYCTEHQPSLPREPLQQRKAVTRPFEQIHMDILPQSTDAIF